MDIKKPEKPQWSQLSPSAVLFTETELLPKSLQRAKHSPFLQNNRQRLSSQLCSDTPDYLAVAESTDRSKKHFCTNFYAANQLSWLEEGYSVQGLADNYELFLSAGHPRDLPSSGAHFLVLSSWCLFRGKQASNEPALPPAIPNPSLFGVDHLWLLKLSLQYIFVGSLS